MCTQSSLYISILCTIAQYQHQEIDVGTVHRAHSDFISYT